MLMLLLFPNLCQKYLSHLVMWQANALLTANVCKGLGQLMLNNKFTWNSAFIDWRHIYLFVCFYIINNFCLTKKSQICY